MFIQRTFMINGVWSPLFILILCYVKHSQVNNILKYALEIFN
jgi:hypothetical protein